MPPSLHWDRPKRTFSWENFHDATTAAFTPCDAPRREPDFSSYSGSDYWNVPGAVIRRSDHWCAGIKSCDWYLLHHKDWHGEATAICDYREFIDKQSGEFYRSMAAQNLESQRQCYARDPIFAPLYYAVPARPLKGRGYSRIDFGHRLRGEWLDIWNRIPEAHKCEAVTSVRMRGRYYTWSEFISPEAADAIDNLNRMKTVIGCYQQPLMTIPIPATAQHAGMVVLV